MEGEGHLIILKMKTMSFREVTTCSRSHSSLEEDLGLKISDSLGRKARDVGSQVVLCSTEALRLGPGH